VREMNGLVVVLDTNGNALERLPVVVDVIGNEAIRLVIIDALPVTDEVIAMLLVDVPILGMYVVPLTAKIREKRWINIVERHSSHDDCYASD
jgi:hypothetical protein